MTATEREPKEHFRSEGGGRASPWQRFPIPSAEALPAWWNRQLDQERRSRSSFALIPIGMMVGIIAFHGFDLRPSPVFLFLVIIAGFGLIASGRGISWLRILALLAAWGSIGAAASTVEMIRTRTVILSGEATVRIEGPVILRERDERGRYRYTIDVVATERPVLSRPPSRVRILVSSRHEPLAIGATYRGLVRLRPPAGPAYPGAYDFAFAPYFDGLGAYGFSLGAPEPSRTVRNPTFGDRLARLRLSMGERIRAVLPGATGAVASALITGERAGIPEDIETALRATSLAHVLSISGFHMALVAGFTMLLVRSALAAIPAFALRFSSKKVAAFVAIGASTFYFLLSGDNAATERSYIMLLIMLSAVLVDRPAITLRNVAIAALIVMALSPYVVLTATFQMSFAATAALVGAYGAYSRWQTARQQRMGSHDSSCVRTALLILAGVALSSLIAGAATAPFGIYHFQRVAPFGLVANVIATPIFSFWIMPLGLLAVIAMPFGLEAIALHPLGWGLDLVFEIATYLAAVLPDQATGLMSPAALLTFASAILALSFFSSALRWSALPLVLIGLLLLGPSPRPELVIFEDGREIALVPNSGPLLYLRERPSGFVGDQWNRAFGSGDATAAEKPTTNRRSAASAEVGAQQLATAKPSAAFICDQSVCRATTPSGRRIAWTDDYEKLGEVCDTSDVAIVARAVRSESCRSGARLVTLRTLRRSRSLALYPANGEQKFELVSSIQSQPREWNLHRLARWPEFWRNPDKPQARPDLPDTKGGDGTPTASGSGESNPPASPEP